MKSSERIVEMHTDIKWIKESLKGNGGPGILERLRNVENKQYYFAGGLIVVMGVLKLLF